MRRPTSFVFVLSLAVMLSGCGGAGRTAIVPASPPSVTGGQSTQRGTANLTIKIPAGATTQADHRSLKYVSPSTTKMLVNVKQAGTSITGYPQTIGLTPSSPNCSVVAGATVCTIQLLLAAGSYTADLTLEDNAGTKLSLADAVPIAVTLGATNTIPVVLAGIPVSVSVASASPVVTGSAAAGFSLAGAGPHQIVLNALDADGNIIVGSGQPSYTVSASGSLALTVATPDPTMPNMLTLTPPKAQTSATASLTFNGSYPSGTDGCAQSGAVCSTSPTTFSATPLLAIAYYNYIGLFLPGQTTPLYSITAGVSGPVGIKFDANGNIYTANAKPGYTGTITEYAPPYNEAAPTATVTETSAYAVPNAITTDPSGNVYVANGGEQNVTEYAPGLQSTLRVLSGQYDPIDVCTDPSGDIFLLNGQVGGSIVEFPPTGTTMLGEYGISDPDKIACDLSGNAYAAQYYLDDGSGTYTTEVQTFGPDLANPSSLGRVYGPNGLNGGNDGRVYVMNSGDNEGNNISRYEPGQSAPDEVIPVSIQEPFDVVTDTVGNFWVTDIAQENTYYYPLNATASTYEISEVGPAYAFGGMDISF